MEEYLNFYSHRIAQTTKCIKETFTPNTIKRLLRLANQIANSRYPLVLTAGNGGSHSLAEHLTGELIWRLDKDREIRIPSICLTSNATILTALSNDTSYETAINLYSRALEKLNNEIEPFTLIGFSTSGNSKNITNLFTSFSDATPFYKVLFAGQTKSKEDSIDEVFTVNSSDKLTTAIIQEVHQVYVHILCEMISGQLKNV